MDIDTYRRPDGSLGHRVYRKPTHTNLYLNARSHRPPSNKQAVLSIVVPRARALCYGDSLHVELLFLTERLVTETGRFILSINLVQISANRIISPAQ
jgi:hypothetical protein